jgi:hypothetical protein
LQARPAIRHALAGEVHQQRLADALAALRRADEQVFQKDAGAAAEGRKIVEPDRHANRLAVPFRDLAKQPRVVAKQRGGDVGLAGLDFVQQLFVFGEFANQRQDQSGFTGTRTADGERHSIALVAHTATHTATWALMCGCGS